MKTRLLCSCVLGVELVVFLLSASVTQANEARIPLTQNNISVSANSTTPRSQFHASPNSGPLPEIAATLSFTTYLPVVINAASACAVAPTLSNPANASILNTLIPTLQWNAGTDPAGTRTVVDVAKDYEFTKIRTQIWSNGGQGTGQYQFSSNLDPATILYWRAHLECGSSLQSPYSTVWSFTTGSGGVILPAPALVSPANGSALSSLSANLQWSGVGGATQYLVSWKKVGNQWTNTHRESGTEYSFTFDPASTYQWWINAQNAYAIGAPSATWQFTTPAGDASPLDRSRDVFVTDDGATTVVEE